MALLQIGLRQYKSICEVGLRRDLDMMGSDAEAHGCRTQSTAPARRLIQPNLTVYLGHFAVFDRYVSEQVAFANDGFCIP